MHAIGLSTTTIMVHKRQFEELDNLESVSQLVLSSCVDAGLYCQEGEEFLF